MITGERLADLDELVLRCKDQQAKQYIAEAVACYRAGAFRSCIVSTWTAVLFDFLHKLRQLDLAGDKNARVKLEAFERTRATADTKGALDFERSVLQIAKDEFGFLSPLEYDDLKRLYDDRNRCAHPSMQSLEEPYTPPAELARCHLRNAVVHILQHPPVQGKAALDIIWKDIGSIYFPMDKEEAIRYFRNGPLAHARDPLVQNMIKGLSTDLLHEDRPDSERIRQFAGLGAVLEMYTRLGEDTLHQNLARIVSGVADSNFGKVISYLRYVAVGWECIEEANQIKARSYIENTSPDTATVTFTDALYIPALKPTAVPRLSELSGQALTTIMAKEERPELVDAAISKFVNSATFKETRDTARDFVLPIASKLTKNQLVALLEATCTNSQITGNWSTKTIMSQIFTNAPDFGDEVKEVWERVYRVFRNEGALPEEAVLAQIRGRYSIVEPDNKPIDEDEPDPFEPNPFDP